jgi:pyoverdine/dityrosine biosynthesis protein Dit1
MQRDEDLLTIPDRDVWAYGQALRAMAFIKGFNNLSFTRLKDLVSMRLPPELEEITYVANATNFRREIMNRFGQDDIDIDQRIASDPDTHMTYLGYSKFLESDLRYLYPRSSTRSNNAYKRSVRYLAKQMLIRGYVSSSYAVLYEETALIRRHRHLLVRSRQHSQTICAFPYICQLASINYP